MKTDVDMRDETEEGFKKASTMTSGKKRASQDFSFMKRKVIVNVVESQTKEYILDKEEKESKQRKAKKY